jgi:murein DD-endopeptidase MepM/ murein hydrolase activator NlpD
MLNNKSAGFDTGFMNHFRQKPAQTTKRNSADRRSFSVPRKQGQSRTERQYEDRQEPRGSGFSFPVPSLMTLLVVAGIVFISLVALKWEGIDIKTPDSSLRVTINEEKGNNIALGYVQTGVPSIAQGLTVTESGKNIAETVIDSAEIASDLTVTFKWTQYKVAKGDVVSKIAEKFGVSTGAIIASNEIRNVRKLQEGAVIRIPNIDGIPYIIKKNDSLTKISAAFKIPLDVILDVNDIKSDVIKEGETIFIPGARMNDVDLRLSMGELFISPIQNKFITSSYGMRKDPISGKPAFHTGIDLRADTGTPVLAAMDGTVSVVSNDRVFGQYIILSHNNGYKTLYAHLSAFSVKQGDRVVQGKKIGAAGNTGLSTGPHLHFGVYKKNGDYVNPLDLMN